MLNMGTGCNLNKVQKYVVLIPEALHAVDSVSLPLINELK